MNHLTSNLMSKINRPLRIWSLVLLFPAFTSGLFASCPPVLQDALGFPAAAAADQGVDPEALELLVEEVERLLAADTFVGAELHVIENRHTVLHRTFGYADRDEARPLDLDSIFCVRSMTKPLVGTAIQMLLDEGLLTLDTTAAEILPAWDTPATSDITIEHLLTHTSGLPFTTISGPLSQYAALADVAAEAAATKFLFEPGTGFQYSDAGADTLGAIVAEITGEPVEVFLQDRLLEPLQMRDSLTLLEPGNPSLARIPSAYSGSTGAWMRHWKSTDDPIFPLFLTSQSLYSTTSDYARFLALWMDGGRTLLSADAIDRGLTPRNLLRASCGFEELREFYGQQWTLYANAPGSRPVIFGHNGSDGTHAWAWPERDLIVLFFTQTRGTLAGIALESVLDRLLIQDDVDGFREQLRTRALAASELGSYEGLYWGEGDGSGYFAVSAEGERLMLERPGSFVKLLVPTETPGHYHLEGNSSVQFEFEPPEEGLSEAFLIRSSNKTQRQVRHRPEADLPTLDSLLAGLRRAHGLDALDELGAIRMTGTLAMVTRGLEGRTEILFDGRRAFTESTVGGGSEASWLTGDDRVFSRSQGAESSELAGVLREQAILSHPLRRLNDWRADYASVDVLNKVDYRGSPAILVRAVSKEGQGTTKVIEIGTGRLVAEAKFEFIPGVGRIGLQVTYSDFRDVGGLTLPFRSHFMYAYELLGEMVISYETAETGVDTEQLLR